jgi:DNA invertase Pin-like site-specific DNA recombinase
VSGLGVEAQREAVRRYLNGGNWTLVQEVVEIESGKRNDHPAIAEALRFRRLHRATLIIAKLDRLAHNVPFISSLMESGAEFVAVDFPQANRLTVHILAAVPSALPEQESTSVGLAVWLAWNRFKRLDLRIGKNHFPSLIGTPKLILH